MQICFPTKYARDNNSFVNALIGNSYGGEGPDTLTTSTLRVKVYPSP